MSHNETNEWMFPIIGQGTFIFNRDVKGPFTISVVSKEGAINLAITKDSATFSMKTGRPNKQNLLSKTKTKNCGYESGKIIAYWYSYDRDNLVLKYGKGYRMEETTILTHDFLDGVCDEEDKKKTRVKLYPFFNAEYQMKVRLIDDTMIPPNKISGL